MNTVKGTVQNGHIVLDDPTGLPEGCRVIVEPIGEETFGPREEEWEDTPEAIAAWLQWYDALPPLQTSPSEEVEWQAARQARKDGEKAAFDERADKLRGMWE